MLNSFISSIPSSFPVGSESGQYLFLIINIRRFLSFELECPNYPVVPSSHLQQRMAGKRLAALLVSDIAINPILYCPPEQDLRQFLF